MERIFAQLAELIENGGLQQSVSVAFGEDGVRISVKASALFRAGVATVDPEALWLVDSLAVVTRDIDVPVIVAGHADNQPIRSATFASNWELSAVRAAGVARRFVANGQDPASVVVEAFGEYRPVATNETVEGRAANRRVEFFYSRQAVIESVTRWRSEVATNESSGAGQATEGN